MSDPREMKQEVAVPFMIWPQKRHMITSHARCSSETHTLGEGLKFTS